MSIEVNVQVVQVFSALADANRLRIIAVLTPHCQSVNEIARQVELPQPLVSHHLRILRERGLARADRRGGSTFY